MGNILIDQAMPVWRGKEWQTKVLDNYLPSMVLYENPAVTKSFTPGKHCSVTFLHQLSRGMTTEIAELFKQNILDTYENGKKPPITQVRAAFPTTCRPVRHINKLSTTCKRRPMQSG